MYILSFDSLRARLLNSIAVDPGMDAQRCCCGTAHQLQRNGLSTVFGFKLRTAAVHLSRLCTTHSCITFSCLLWNCMELCQSRRADVTLACAPFVLVCSATPTLLHTYLSHQISFLSTQLPLEDISQNYQSCKHQRSHRSAKFQILFLETFCVGK